MTLDDAEWVEFEAWWRQRWGPLPVPRMNIEIFLEWREDREKDRAKEK